MTGQVVELCAGFGERPFIPYIDRDAVGTATEHSQVTTVPERLAVAGMALVSLDAVPVYGWSGDTEVTSQPPKALDIEYVRALSRLHTGGSAGPSYSGVVESLLQQGFSVDVTARHGGALGSRQARELSAYHAFSFWDHYPRAGHLTRALGGVGVSAAAWVEVQGGLPEADMGTSGTLAFVILGGSAEKVKVHTPGNAEVSGADGLYFNPAHLLAPGKSTLYVVSRREYGIYGART